MEELGDAAPSTLNFSVGYYEGRHVYQEAAHYWRIWMLFINNDKTDVCLWAEGVRESEHADSKCK
jgi:hypothetical protein